MQHFDTVAGRYTKFSNDLLDLVISPCLKPTEVSVLALIVWGTRGWTGYEGKSPYLEVNLSISQIAEKTKRSEKSVVRALAQLQSIGVLVVTSKGGGKDPNRYMINYDRSEWRLPIDLEDSTPSPDNYKRCRRVSEVAGSSVMGDRATGNNENTQDTDDRGGSVMGDRGGPVTDDRTNRPQSLAVTWPAPPKRKEKKLKKIHPQTPSRGTGWVDEEFDF